MVGEKKNNLQILVNLFVVNVQGESVAVRRLLDCSTCRLLDVGAGSGPPDRADELLIKQGTAYCGQAISSFKVTWLCHS